MLKHLMTVSAAALFAGGAVAQQAMDSDVTQISAWNYDELYAMQGIRGENLIGADALGAGGEDLGDVENVYFDGDQAVAIIVETNAFFDIGDRWVIVPWDEVEIADGEIVIPITEENLEEYDIWNEGSVVSASLDQMKLAEEDEAAPTPGLYRLSDLLDDYVMAGGSGWGYVDDIIMSRDGTIEAVVTMARGGYYATPYYGPGYGYAPTAGTYDVGYGADELEGLDEFDPGVLDNDDWF